MSASTVNSLIKVAARHHCDLEAASLNHKTIHPVMVFLTTDFSVPKQKQNTLPCAVFESFHSCGKSLYLVTFLDRIDLGRSEAKMSRGSRPCLS